MAVGSWSCLVILFSLILVSRYCHGSPVPVISWWGVKSASPATTDVLAGHTLLKKEFQAYFEPLIKKNDMLVVFIQDELSIDDFTRYGNSFPFIKSSLDPNKHIVMPSVTQADGSIVDYLLDIQESNIVEVPLETDWTSFDVSAKLKNDASNLIVIKLEPVMGSDKAARESILKRNDKLIEMASSSLSKKKKSFAMLYTSERPSQDVQNILTKEEIANDHSLNSRHLLADKGSMKTEKFLKSECVALYIRGLEFGTKKNMTQLVDAVSNETVTGTCGGGISSITIKTNNDTEEIPKGMTVTVNIATNGTLEWACKSIDVKGKYKRDGNLIDIDETFDCGMHDLPWTMTSYNTIVSPVQYSFACNSMEFISKLKNFTLTLQGMQVEAYTTNSTLSFRFKDAYNCEGFFTLEILTGLFIGGLLMASLFLGTMMMMNIQTQDRFDDPKGKTITVGAQE